MLSGPSRRRLRSREPPCGFFGVGRTWSAGPGSSPPIQIRERFQPGGCTCRRQRHLALAAQRFRVPGCVPIAPPWNVRSPQGFKGSRPIVPNRLCRRCAGLCQALTHENPYDTRSPLGNPVRLLHDVAVVCAMLPGHCRSIPGSHHRSRFRFPRGRCASPAGRARLAIQSVTRSGRHLTCQPPKPCHNWAGTVQMA